MSTIRKAYIELSNGIRGLRLHREQNNTSSSKESISNYSQNQRVTEISVTGFLPKMSSRLKAVLHARALNTIKSTTALWTNDHFLAKFFCYFTIEERGTLALVCKKWHNVAYTQKFWINVLPIYNCRKWRSDENSRMMFYHSLEQRGFDSICFSGALDSDIIDFINNCPFCRKQFKSVIIRCSGISDAGLGALFKSMCCVHGLEISSCNDITEAGLWACLNPKLTRLTITDCINIADDTIGAISQMLPVLTELNLQAYHVTDAALSLFSVKQSSTLVTLRLLSCWEITNHGIVNIVQSLSNLTILSLSGCSKITDDGVELIAENLSKLRELDLSWCNKITDASLESIACDLAHLEWLCLDRCTHITDIGIGYLSTMSSLTTLYLRWCTQVRDYALQHLSTMRQLRVLSLAGCVLLTRQGLGALVHLRGLQEVELTNCSSVSAEILEYLQETLTDCSVIY